MKTRAPDDIGRRPSRPPRPWQKAAAPARGYGELWFGQGPALGLGCPNTSILRHPARPASCPLAHMAADKSASLRQEASRARWAAGPRAVAKPGACYAPEISTDIRPLERGPTE